MFRKSLFILSLSAVSQVASAAGGGIYFGASFLDVNSSFSWPSSARTDREDGQNGFKVLLGFRPFSWLAIEGNYADAGEAGVPLETTCIALVGAPCPSRASIDTKIISASAMTSFSLRSMDIFLRTGLAQWKTVAETQYNRGANNAPMRLDVKNDGLNGTFGGGVQWRIRDVALRAEYERIDVLNSATDLFSIGMMYSF